MSYRAVAWLSLGLFVAFASRAVGQVISFDKTVLVGETSDDPTSVQFGPDNRLYVAQQNGLIKAYTVVRNGPGDYAVTGTETIGLIRAIPNHDDDGQSNPAQTDRQVTGILVTGTAANPVIYVSSSDPRIAVAGDSGLDTNSGIVSRLTWNGSTWDQLDLVRGLPRSEENHSSNGMQLDAAGGILYLCQGGNTDMGAPSISFSFLPEYALSAAILSIDLDVIGGSTYDLPTLNDPSRPDTGPGGTDENDPFGGNNGANQAIVAAGGPVQVYSPGYRNPYDLVLMADGRMYAIDNGANSGWGGPPVGEGPAGTCTNDANDSGSASQNDQLHYVSGPGYYAGHPNPTRANTANTFNGQSPVPAGNPVECDHRAPGIDDGALATWNTSVNGLIEYTGSNFGGAMQGDLLACGWGTGAVYRIQLNATGDAVIGTSTLFSSVGTNPLDITAQGDGDFLAGTIWVCNHGSDEIIVYEPADLVLCSGTNDPLLDEDLDGYTNADELDNGTDPCSAGDVPPDYDGDLVSDLNDPDDDDDGIADVSDAFAIDAYNGLTTALPVDYGWGVGEPGFGLLGAGFTGLMVNGVDDYLDLFDPANMTAGGAAGKITIDNVPAGDALGTTNTQEYAFQFGVNVSASTGAFTVHGKVDAPFFNGTTPADFQSLGVFIGSGDQDNFVRIVMAANGGAGGIEVVQEDAGSATPATYAAAVLGASSVELYLSVDPVNGRVQPRASIDGGAVTDLGSPLALTGATLDAVQGGPALAVGIIATSAGATPFAATWDFLQATADDTGAAADVVIDPPGTGIDGSTYNSGSFAVTNTSTGGQRIERVVFDLVTAILPDLVFDPDKLAGDIVAKPFQVDSAGGTGTITPNHLNSFHNGVDDDEGFDRLEVSYTDFDPGETMTFSIDNDPTSIKGTTSPGPNEAGSVSGLELSGTRVVVEFDDGTVLTAYAHRTGATLDASDAVVESGPPPAPGIEVLGVASNPAVVTSANQTVRLTGPPGADVRVLVVEGGLFITGMVGPYPDGYDLDPFEASSAVAVNEFIGTIGPGGTVDLPITLTRLDPAGDPGVGVNDVTGINHVVAVIEEPSGRTGVPSPRVVLQLIELESPAVLGTAPAAGAVNVPRNTAVVADPVNLPNGVGIDPATLDETTVFLERTGDGTPVAAILNLDGAGAIFTLQPIGLPDANTSYTFTVTSGLADLMGAAFLPFSMSFTTGTSGAGDPTDAAFEPVDLPTTAGSAYTTVTFGPDGLLYAATQEGQIHRWVLNPDGTTGAREVLDSLRTAEGGDRLLIGLTFDPAATAGNLIAWVSHTTFGFSDMPDWGGKITRLSGPNLETVEDIVIGLPRSAKDHVTNSIAFGPDGAIYFTQGSNSAMGDPDSAWSFRPERLLNAAVLRLDPLLVTAPPLDVQTEEGGSYDPYAPGAPLTLYATGVRNAYDLLWHSNGRLYVPTNGSASGGNTPEGVIGAVCADGSTYAGPAVPALTNVGDQNDYLYRIDPGGYYGHPNPLRCAFVLNGGNPTSGSDPAEVTEYPVGTDADVNYRGFAHDFGAHFSPNGVIEYTNDHFDGALQGRILVVRYSAGDDIIVLTPGAPDLDIVDSVVGVPGFTGLNNPLDLTENPDNGYVYVSEFGAAKITLLRPVETLDVSPLALDFGNVVVAQTSAAQSVTVTNDTGSAVTIDALTLGGPQSGDFGFTVPATPFTLLDGEFATIDVTFTPSALGLRVAALTIASADIPADVDVDLSGTGTAEGAECSPAGCAAPLDVTVYFANVTVASLTDAENVVANPGLQDSVVSESADVINYLNTSNDGHYTGNNSFPGMTIGQDEDDFVVLVTGSVVIPTAGNWTVGVNSDDGFGLELTRGVTVFSMSFPSTRAAGDTLSVFNVTEPGVYDLRLVYFERAGGSELELFAAEGSFASFSSAAFRLVGDAANGGWLAGTACTPEGTNCDDGLFCNGVETCDQGNCVGGTPPCPAVLCDEGTDTCADCQADGECDDGEPCNGAETCDVQSGACVPGHCDTEQVLLVEFFDRDAGPFAYQDDTFRGTANPGLASGAYSPTGGQSGGGLQVQVGGNGTNMSGGWVASFDVTGSPDSVRIELAFRLLFSGGYEPDEFGEALMSVDGTLIGVPPNDYLLQFVGDASSTFDSGFVTESFDLALADGSHQIIVGAYNNKSTVPGEITQAFFDDVSITATYNTGCVCCPGGQPLDCSDGNPCTDDTCAEPTGCVNTSNTDPCDEGADACVNVASNGLCDNGLFCDGTETCDPLDGCTDGPPPDCSDGVDCTADWCDEGADACVNVASNGLCDNGLFCDGPETCDAMGGCLVGDFACAFDEWCDESADACEPHGNGDFEPDGDVDLRDFQWFQFCFSQSVVTSGCEPANLTGQDDQIDAADLEAFVNQLTGP